MFSSQFVVPLGFISHVVPFLWDHIPHANHCVMTMRPAELGWAIWHCHWAGCFIISVSWWARHWSRIYCWALLVWSVPWWLRHVFCDVMVSLKYANSAVYRGRVGLWGFLWWAPSAKRKDHHGVSSGWSSVWHRSNTGLSSTQYEQIPIVLGVWPFWLTTFFFRSITFWRAYG